MAVTPSSMLPLGTPAPGFRLPDPTGRRVTLEDFADAPALVVAFLCNHCPYVKHIRHEVARFAQDVRSKGVAMVAINSNDVSSYPDDSPEQMAREIEAVGYVFPYLFDETQQVAKAYRAACTPDFFLFDRERKLVYRGRFDESRPGNDRSVTGSDLRAAIDALLAGERVDSAQQPSVGCNIKWKPGNEPDYA